MSPEQPRSFNFWETEPKKNFSPWFITFCVVLIIIGLAIAGYFKYQAYQTYYSSPPEIKNLYIDNLFGFSIELPSSWKGYTVNHIKGDIYDLSGQTKTNNGVVDSFQIIELHHPLENANNPREVMPIIIFTPTQWQHIQKEEWSVGAAPISPSMLGQNSQWILALPARYNYDYKPGWEEVDQLVHTLKVIEPSATTSGTLTGKVTIGPNCPVEQAGNPCLTPPEAYATRDFLVLNSSQKRVANFHADASGNFSLTLPPGTYTITSAKTGIGFMNKDLPKIITIKAGETIMLNIDIDTGIR